MTAMDGIETGSNRKKAWYVNEVENFPILALDPVALQP
ncbi:unnamed protein product, partial [marine sediment metagenome]